MTRTLDADERIRAQRGLVTRDTEVNFGREPTDALPELTLDLEGLAVSFRGQIDRIDTAAEPTGASLSTTTRPGSAKGFTGLDEDPVLQGTKIQLAMPRARAVAHGVPGPAGARRLLAHRGARGEGAARLRPRRRGPAGRVVLGTIAAGVAAGTFPAYPGKENPYFRVVRPVRLLRLRPALLPRSWSRLRREVRRSDRGDLRRAARAEGGPVTPDAQLTVEPPVPADQDARDRIHTELAVHAQRRRRCRYRQDPRAGPAGRRAPARHIDGGARDHHLHDRGGKRAAGTRPRAGRRARAKGEPDDGPYTRALHSMDDAVISTLHTFAQRILSEHPLEAALPPGFEVLDAIQESVAFESWWQRTLDQVFDDPVLADSLLVLGALGIKPSRYRQIAEILTDHHDRTAGYGISRRPVPALDLDPLLQALDDAVTVRASCIDPDDKMAVHLEELAELRIRLGGPWSRRARGDRAARRASEAHLHQRQEGPLARRRQGARGQGRVHRGRTRGWPRSRP